jgi:phage gp29-like protein
MALLDAYGNPVDVKLLRQEVAGPTMLGIRHTLSDHPSNGLTPQRLASLLVGSEDGDPLPYLALAEDMEEKDLNYRAQLGTRKLAIAGLEPSVEAASDAPADQAAADLVREYLAKDGLEEVLMDILDALGKGFSVSEILWDTTGRRWFPQEILWRDPRWFMFDRTDGATVQLRDIGPPQNLPPFKFIVHRPRLKSGIPIRGGLARASAWAYLFANYAMKDWVGFLEIFGQPMRIGKYPAGSTPEQIAILTRAVRDIGSDAAAVVPDGMLMEFISATSVGASSDVYEKLLRYLDERVTLAVLGQTLTSGQTRGGGGSLALGQVHNEVRKDLMRADARQLGATINRDLVKPLVDLNLGARDAYPRVVYKVPEPEDIKGLTEALQILVPLGLRVEASVVRDKLGLPDPGQDAEILTPPKVPTPAPPPAAAPALATAHSRGACPGCGSTHAAGSGDGGPDALDDLAAEALGDWTAQLQPLTEPLVAAIQGAQSLEELQSLILEAAGRMDPSKLAGALAQATFMARAAGEGGMAPFKATGGLVKDLGSYVVGA